MSNKTNQQKEPDTSKVSQVTPAIATLAEATVPEPTPNNLKKEDVVSEQNPIITNIFGNATIATVVEKAKANTFFESDRYLNFKRFYQQNPTAVSGVVDKMFTAWQKSPFAIELELLEQENLYVRDANAFRNQGRCDMAASMLTQVAYTLYIRNEKELTALLTDTPDDGRGILEIAEVLMAEKGIDVLENIEFGRFWRELAYR